MNLDDATLLPDLDPLTFPRAEQMEVVLQRWHNETHPGPWLTCDEQPCHAIQRL